MAKVRRDCKHQYETLPDGSKVCFECDHRTTDMRGEREKRGLMQQTTARAIGMTQPAYARIEAGAREPTKVHLSAFRMAMRLYDLGEWAWCLFGDEGDDHHGKVSMRGAGDV
jgi:DNA-binding XRE family transcriptional regulator